MTVEFTPEEQERLLNFVGYGRLDAPYWFLGMEEGTGGEKDSAKLIGQNVRIRARQFEPVMDLYESHLLLNIDITTLQKFTPVWMWMAKLLRGLEGATDWQDTIKAKDYIRNQLGRKGGETLLTELLPLPAPSLEHWFYESLFPDKKAYLQKLIPLRQAHLRNLIEAHHPRFVFAYGASYRNFYQAVLESEDWQPLGKRSVITWKHLDETTFLTMPFFGVGAISTADMQQTIDALRST